MAAGDLGRRAVAEAVGTGLLVAAVMGSGIAASRLSPDDVGLQLLENSLATGVVLAALIVALQPVSAAFNPVITLLERALGAIGNREAVVLIAAQLAGGVAGAVLANLMFGLPPITLSDQARVRPADQINAVAVAAMAEEGIDVAREQPKILTADAVQVSDVVITMGCGDTCPYYPGKRYEDWVLHDPAGVDLDQVRPVRDEIRRASKT